MILAGFRWHDQSTAEAMIKELAQNGVDVVVDLTHSQEDPFARIPHFLDVWGERIILGDDPLLVAGNGEFYNLAPFAREGQLWYTITPQGLDQETLTYEFLGQPAVVSGYKDFGGKKIYFVGFNLAYHVVGTNDNEAVRILSDLLQKEPFQESNYQSIALDNYEVNAIGMNFDYFLDTPNQILIPIAEFEGTKVEIDGVRVNSDSLATLLVIDAPAGSHHVTISVEPTSIYFVGIITSLLAILILIIASLVQWKEKQK